MRSIAPRFLTTSKRNLACRGTGDICKSFLLRQQIWTDGHLAIERSMILEGKILGLSFHLQLLSQCFHDAMKISKHYLRYDFRKVGGISYVLPRETVVVYIGFCLIFHVVLMYTIKEYCIASDSAKRSVKYLFPHPHHSGKVFRSIQFFQALASCPRPFLRVPLYSLREHTIHRSNCSSHIYISSPPYLPPPFLDLPVSRFLPLQTLLLMP